MTLIAIIRVRGSAKIPIKVERTLELLNLPAVNNCAVVQKTESSTGMIQKTKDYITWGEVNADILKKMLKRAKVQEPDKAAAELIAGKTPRALSIKQPFRLHPPRKGYRSIKTHFKQGGALGYRSEKINDLIMRMV